MSVVMPPLLQSAQLKPDVTITSAESDDEIESDDDRSVIHSIAIFYLLD
jgi:importin-5